jgi:hypothetical protein
MENDVYAKKGIGSPILAIITRMRSICTRGMFMQQHEGTLGPLRADVLFRGSSAVPFVVKLLDFLKLFLANAFDVPVMPLIGLDIFF